MNVQNLILSALRRAPRRLVRHMAGPPIEVDGFAMDSNIQMANLAAKRAAAQNHETPSLAQIREAGNGFDAIARAAAAMSIFAMSNCRWPRRH